MAKNSNGFADAPLAPAYNFDERIDRLNSGSAKWNYYKDVIPMWMADMDFKSPPAIAQALHARIDHGVFGYEFPSAAPTQAVVTWLDKRYGWKVQADDIMMLPALVSGMALVSKALGHIGEHAITFTPIYHPFLSVPANQGVHVTEVQLKPIMRGNYMDYEIDFDAFERAITPRTSLFLHCHPHNPAGREFTVEENRRIAEICLKHNLTVVTDEIWADLTLEGTDHVPFAALSEEIGLNTVTLMAPSKTFNVPSLGFGFAVIQNPKLRQRIMNTREGLIPYNNLLGMVAAEAAYTECDSWLAALKSYLTENRNVALDYIAENMPDIRATQPNATYLMWLDCKAAGIEGNAQQFFIDKAKVALSDGEQFGAGGEGYVRMNFGCPRAQLLEALDQMRAALRAQ